MRRIPALIASALVLAACQLSLPSGSTGAGASSSGAGGSADPTPCDGKKDCDACHACSLNVQCATEVAVCKQSSSCLGIDQCFEGCGSDSTCQEQCYLLGPDGEAAHRALRACIFCDACPSDCAGYVVCK